MKTPEEILNLFSNSKIHKWTKERRHLLKKRNSGADCFLHNEPFLSFLAGCHAITLPSTSSPALLDVFSADNSLSHLKFPDIKTPKWWLICTDFTFDLNELHTPEVIRILEGWSCPQKGTYCSAFVDFHSQDEFCTEEFAKCFLSQ